MVTFAFQAVPTYSYLCIWNDVNFRLPLYLKWCQLQVTLVFEAMWTSGLLAKEMLSILTDT